MAAVARLMCLESPDTLKAIGHTNGSLEQRLPICSHRVCVYVCVLEYLTVWLRSVSALLVFS